MDTARKQTLIVARAQLRRLLVLRPFVLEALQPRNIEHAAGKRGSGDALEVAADGLALGVKRSKPGSFGDAAAALVDDFARQPISQHAAGEAPPHAVPAEHGLRNGEHEFEQLPVAERAASRNAHGFELHAQAIAPELVTVEYIIGAQRRTAP